MKLRELIGALPGQWKGRPGQRRKARQVLGAMIHSLDENIGRVLNAIDKAAIRRPSAIPGGRRITAPPRIYRRATTLLRTLGVKDHGGKSLNGIDALDLLT